MLATDPPAPAAHIRDIDYIRVAEPAPVVLAYGIGVDSTALLVELESRGTPPDLVLTGDPGIEKPETYAYQKMIAAWMAARGIRYETVRYTPRRFKHWPPYYDLLANVLTNATLPHVLRLADQGWRAATEADPHLAAGLSTHHGVLLSEEVAQAHGLERGTV